MVSRRAPRWVYWPGKLLWAPSLLFGLLLTLHAWPQVTERREGTWSVIVTIGTPDVWVSHLETFVPGIITLIVGVVALIMYTRWPEHPSRLTLVEYPAFTIAAWCFGALTAFSLLRFGNHQAGVGGYGFDWRFLAYARTTTVDLVVAGLGIAGCVVCWLLSWGFSSEANPGYDHQQRHAG